MKKFLIVPILIFIILIFNISPYNKTNGNTPPSNIDTINIIDIIDTTAQNPNLPDTTIVEPHEPEIVIEPEIIIPTKTIREQLLDTLNGQLYVREITPNRAPMVDLYLRVVNSQVGLPWCAAFVGANLTWLDVPNPNSAWSPSFAMTKDIIWKPRDNKYKTKLLTGDVVSFFYTNLGRVGHVGFYEKEDGFGYFITIEGNTNGAGSREGDGVYKKKRDPNKIHAGSRYIFN